MKFFFCFFAFAIQALAVPEPTSFQINCKACHILDEQVVGPSLVEIAKIYRQDRDKFIEWTINPGKKRPHQAVMPSMAHVPKEDLNEIYDYILKATKGVKERRTNRNDPFAATPHKLRRPRIQRTFLDKTGPASLYVALPKELNLNLIWDATLCRLRFISEGEPDDWSYWKSNGNSFSKHGQIIYTETEALLNLDPQLPRQFQGYRINNDGLPTFLYSIGDIEIEETISSQGKQVTRSFQANLPLNLEIPKVQKNRKLKTAVEKSSDRDSRQLIITHTKL